MFGHEIADHLSEIPTGVSGESNQDHSACLRGGHEREPAEILVLGEQNTLFVSGEGDDLGVDATVRLLGQSADVVACLPESPYDGEIAILIGKKAHELDQPAAFGSTTNSWAIESAAY